MLVQVQNADGRTMQVEDSNLPIWSSAGWTLVNSSGTGEAPKDPKPKEGDAMQQREAWVDDLYRKYFDRAATQAEHDNWKAVSPQRLESFLGQEAKKYNYNSQFFRSQESAGTQSAYSLIEADPNLTPEMKALAKQVVQSYKGGIEADSKDILATFSDLKTKIIDPKYASLVKQAETSLQDTIQEQEQARALEREQEGANYEGAVDAAKGDLERRGLTFSGAAVKELGGDSAYKAAQVPFGGPIPEGRLAKQQRLIASSSQNRYMNALRSAGRQAEGLLGSGGVQGIFPGYAPIGGMQGTLEQQKNKELATTLGQVAGNQQAKTGLLTNTQPNL